MQDPERIEAYFAGDLTSPAEMCALRALLLDCGLSEEWKWRAPCYTAHGGNVAMPMDFKTGCVLSFFKGVLLDDRADLLAVPGANSRSARVVPVPSVAVLGSQAVAIRALVGQAVENERRGLKVVFAKDDLEWPGELVERLDADAELRAAFEALTPGRQRGYVLHFSGAKQAATRAARIDRHAARIVEGKGLQDR